jgi:hypothetical protein
MFIFKLIWVLILLAASIGWFIAPLTTIILTISGGLFGFFAAVGINITCYIIVASEA